MSTKKPQCKQTLAAFIDDLLKSGTVKQTKWMKKWCTYTRNTFTEALGRTPLVADLNHYCFAQFVDYIEHNNAPSTRGNLRFYLRRFWRLALKAGLVDDPPPVHRFLRGGGKRPKSPR